MPTRNVVLTDHQSSLIDRLVASGRYQNASEAMRAGLRLVEEQEAAREALRAYLDDLRAELDHAAPESFRPAEEVFAELRAKYATERT